MGRSHDVIVIDSDSDSDGDYDSEIQFISSKPGSPVQERAGSPEIEIVSVKKGVKEREVFTIDEGDGGGKRRKVEGNKSQSPAPPSTLITLSTLDQPFNISAQERTTLLLCIFNVTKKLADTHRKKFEKGKKLVSIWALVESFADEGSEKKLRDVDEEDDVRGDDDSLSPVGRSEKISRKAMISYAIGRLKLTLDQKVFDAKQAASLTANPDPSATGLMECELCCGDYPFGDLVFCEHPSDNGAEQHVACGYCVNQYVSKTPRCQAASLTSIPCFRATEEGKGTEKTTIGCRALLPPRAVRDAIGPFNALVFQEKEDERSIRVATGGASAKKIFCTTCNEVVGVVMLEDVGDGHVVCPKCDKKHCGRCGNESHGKEPCPPDEEMSKFLGTGKEAKNTKRCPKCGIGISKAAGCNHMTCSASTGGCGHEFCWLCLGPFPKCDCNHFERQSANLARQMAGGGGGGGGFAAGRGGGFAQLPLFLQNMMQGRGMGGGGQFGGGGGGGFDSSEGDY